MKRLSAFLLALCLALSCPPAQGAFIEKGEAPPPAWSEDAYDALVERFSLSGGMIQFDQPLHTSGAIDRLSFIELLVTALDCSIPKKELEKYPRKGSGYFCDAPDYDTICRQAAGYGIVEGSIGADGRRYLHGEDPLNREQAAKMVCSLLDFVSQKLGKPLIPLDSPATYADAASVSAWALPYTRQIASYGLMRGDASGNFIPQGELDWPSCVVLVSRILDLFDAPVGLATSALPLRGETDWSKAAISGFCDYSVSKALTGRSQGYYTIDNGDGTVSGLVVSADADAVVRSPEGLLIGPDGITVERFDADGGLVSSQILDKELPIFGAFLDGGDCFYLAFGQKNSEEDDRREVWRIVQYDRNWKRLGAASVSGRDSYTAAPFASTVSRMAVSPDGKTLALHTARQRYRTEDGLRHQSNITITVNTADMKVLSVSEPLPDNHVSHSFGQFVRFDGEEFVTVDHGDGYPRAFVLHTYPRDAESSWVESRELLKLYGEMGDNVTGAIGSGFEVSRDGYLFLGCSNPQDGTDGPWNVFLSYTPRDLSDTTLTWITHGDTSIDCARLVKLDNNTFLAMWQVGADIHYQRLDGKGQLTGQEQILVNAIMPPTDPVVMDGDVYWIQAPTLTQNQIDPVLFHIDLS